MPCIEIENGIICFANVNFKCPHCGKEYNDSEDKYLDRCNKNRSGCTRILCSCGIYFGMTYGYMGNAVGFKLKSEQWQRSTTPLE